MYSARVNGEPTTFGTSGLLYRSNKVMYDRATLTLWHQFTGEPIIGPLADSGVSLPFFPVILTTWGEWLAEHPDTTVLSLETGIYLPALYMPEEDRRAAYNDYFSSPDTRFPVWLRSDALQTKEVVLGLTVGDASKAYPVAALQSVRVVNDVLGDTALVVIGSSISAAARAYERGERRFAPAGDGPAGAEAPAALVDSDGVVWEVTEDYLVSSADSTRRMPRLPSHTSFWFGWYQFHPDTEIFMPDAD